MITAALDGKLDDVDYVKHAVFGLQMPTECPGVPSNLLNPKNTWENKQEYDETSEGLATKFSENFNSYQSFANDEIRSGAPRITEKLEKA